MTSLAPVRFVPVIVTVVPPAAGPLVGSTFVTVGAGMCRCIGRRRRWRSCRRGCSRSRRTVPEPAGEVAVTLRRRFGFEYAGFGRAELDFAGAVRFVPVIVTIVPPAAGPLARFDFC